ncbi:MAG: ABC transporter substrate-binding protein [Lachnospiraceae bacterium]|nr:ABC transporter substrate-binding protein [Lachnospiraceae bacterium]
MKKIVCYIITILLGCMLLVACAKSDAQKAQISCIGSLNLEYATQFSVDYYTDGYVHIHVEDGNEYVLIPEGEKDTDLGISGATLIHLPCESIYLAASSAMDLFLQMDALDTIATCSTTAEDYTMEIVSEKIKSNEISYVGKYSSPEYETILSSGCNLAIESTMIYHTPKVKEQLETLGIPVLVERSSYEEHPLGRLEWIKLYGVLLGKEEMAEAFFEEQVEAVKQVEKKCETQEQKKSVACFYVSANGYINVRKPGDYLTKMISIAGGSYALEDIELDEENALSTVNINWEDFYKEAIDADILIYNGTVDGGVKSIEELLEKNRLFADFKAVKEGNVWCTNMNMFQESSKIADIIMDFYAVISGDDAAQIQYMYQLY